MSPRAQEHDSATPPAVTEWLTEREAAEYIGYHPVSLKRLRLDGKGPSYAQPIPGGKVRYRRSDLDAWGARR